jgi:hypothetical protein
MDVTGARWSLDGAEAILKLRTLISNGDFAVVSCASPAVSVSCGQMLL